MRIYYLPIEPYPERPTELLHRWTLNQWQTRAEVLVIHGDQYPGSIRTGTVYDAHGRARNALSQVANLVTHLNARVPLHRGMDVIYLEDFHTPGIEALFRLFDQLPFENRPKVYARHYDHKFTRRWPLDTTHIEALICSGPAHARLLIDRGVPFEKIAVLGIPYSLGDVQGLVPALKPTGQRPQRVVFASRLDHDKNPHFLLDVIEQVCTKDTEIEVALCTGASALSSDDSLVTTRIGAMQKRGLNLRSETRMTKASYYSLLASSRVLLCTGAGGHLPYGPLDASALGAAVVAPACGSYCEALRDNETKLYVPWSVPDAAQKVLGQVWAPSPDGGWLASAHDATLSRILSHLQGSPINTPWWT